MDNESSNFSIETAESPSIVPPVLLCILGVGGNAIAVAVVCCAVKSHQWQPFYRFVCGLALTDGLGVMLAVPFAIHRYATDFEYNYSQTVCDYMAVVQMFTIIASAMIVCTMSLERFMAIVFPYVYKSIQKGSRSLVMLVCVWTLSAFLSSGHLLAGSHSRLFYPDSWCFVNFVSDNSTDLVFSFLYALTGLFLLITTFVTNVILVAVIIKKKCSKSSSLTADRHGTHIILFLFSVVLLFSICILPILMNMLRHLIGIHESSPSFELLGIEMATANSVIDPWIYIIFRRETFTLIRRVYYTCTCTRMPVYSSEAKQSTDCTQPMNRENGDLNKDEV